MLKGAADYKPPAPKLRPILPLFFMYGWNGTELKWKAMHAQGPLAMKWGMVHGFYGVPYASAFVDATKGKILLPDDWRETWTSIDLEMLRVTLMSPGWSSYEKIEVSYMELAEYLREIDAKRWLREWNRPDRAIYYGLTVESFKKEMHDLWASEWGDLPPPA